MNHQDLIKELRKDPEYIQAEKDLRFKIRLANAVLYARLAKGWSQTELARHVQTRQANISRIESSDSNPTIELIRRICDVLGIEAAFSGPSVIDSTPVIRQCETKNTSSVTLPTESIYRVISAEQTLSDSMEEL